MTEYGTLRACPFCGSTPVIEEHTDHGWFIGCTNSECLFEPSGYASTKDEAVTQWEEVFPALPI